MIISTYFIFKLRLKYPYLIYYLPYVIFEITLELIDYLKDLAILIIQLLLKILFKNVFKLYYLECLIIFSWFCILIMIWKLFEKSHTCKSSVLINCDLKSNFKYKSNLRWRFFLWRKYSCWFIFSVEANRLRHFPNFLSLLLSSWKENQYLNYIF